MIKVQEIDIVRCKPLQSFVFSGLMMYWSTHDPRNHHADPTVPGHADCSGAGPVFGDADRGEVVSMASRCLKCSQTQNECKCSFRKGRYLCFRCTGLFNVGDEFYSDAPGVIYHRDCYLKEVRKKSENKS